MMYLVICNDSLETVSGQDIMVDEFGMGAFSMVIVENMDNKDVVALKEKLEKVDHVEKIIWYDSVADISLPTDMLPNELKEALFNGDATMMIALLIIRHHLRIRCRQSQI